MSDVQVYGQFHNYGSFSIVSRAVTRELTTRFSGLAYAIGTLNPSYEGCALPTGMNSHAPVGICVSYPQQAVGWLHGHKERILMTVCESDRIPTEWVQACNTMTLVIVPSQFCFEAFQRSGVHVPIMVVPHGVEDWCQPGSMTRPRTLIQPRTLAAGMTSFMHVSGATSFPWRKATTAVIVAFCRIAANHEGKLILFLKMKRNEVLEKKIAGTTVFFDETSYLSTRQMLNVDAVIQPSRGEGFGLVPLEARCLGVPVILTRATGHAQHFVEGVDVEVATGKPAPMMTQGNDVGSAPTVEVEAVEAAMRHFLDTKMHRQHATHEWAKRHGEEWAWGRVLRPLMRVVQKHAISSEPRLLGEDASLKGL